jgi:hypothetical protein
MRTSRRSNRYDAVRASVERVPFVQVDVALARQLRRRTTTGAGRHTASRGRGTGGCAPSAGRRATSPGWFSSSCPSDLVFSVGSNHPRYFFTNVTWSDGASHISNSL